MLIELDIGHKRPSTLPIVMEEQSLMLKVEMNIGLIPVTITPVTKVSVLYCWFLLEILLLLMGELDIGTSPATILPKEEIVGVTVQDMEVVLNISTTHHFQCWIKC